MDRISGAGFVTVGGLRQFQDINQAAGISGTDVVSVWLNGVQESILAVVAAATSPALVPTDADNTQLLQAIDQLIAAAVAGKQNALGFTPVQQGGGPQQQNNRVQLGWDGLKLRAAIDGVDQGGLVDTGNLTTFFYQTNNVLNLPGGLIVQFFEVGFTAGSSGTNTFPTSFPNTCFALVGSVGAPFGSPLQLTLGLAPAGRGSYSWQLNTSGTSGSDGCYIIAIGN